MQDAVDRIQSEWAEVRPELDTSPIAIIGRVSRLSRLVDQQLAKNFREHGLDHNWMYDVMATLRRSGEPYELTAGELVKGTMVTTGAITNRIDRLVDRALVERQVNPLDRRQVVVRLTAAGLALTDEIADSHYEFEERLLGSLTSRQRSTVANALRTMLLDLGDTAPEVDGGAASSGSVSKS